MNTFYVSPLGNDQNPGSKTAPFATLQKAADKVSKTPAQIMVTAGTYYLDTPLTLTEKHSHIHFISENAVLTGAKPIQNPAIHSYSDTIRFIQLKPHTHIDGFLIDGKQQMLSRFPAYDESQSLQGSTSLEAVKRRAQNWTNPQTGFVRTLHDRLWGGNSFTITGKDDTAPHGLSLHWIGDNNRGNGIYTGKHAMVVENIFEELQNPGEWFYDEVSGTLYFIPPKDAKMQTLQVVQTECLLQVSGEDITFDGFTFENTARTMFTQPYIPLMRGDWCVARIGAVLMQNCNHVRLLNCTFQNIGSHAIFIDGHNRRITIDHCHIKNIGACGILLAGHPDSCREPSFWDSIPPFEAENGFVHKTDITDTTVGPAKELYPKHIKITENHIENIGIYEKQSSHIALSVSFDVKMLHNTLHTGPRAGININDGTFGGHEIAFNDIFDMQKETDDHGMFNSWGRDRFWSLGGFDTNGNNGLEKSKYVDLDILAPTEIHHNRIHFASRLDSGSTFGIDLDDGSSLYHIHHNLCLGMGIKLREGFRRNVHHNILIGAPFNLHCTYENSQDVITENLVCCDTPYVLAATDEQRFAVSNDTISGNYFTSAPNLPAFWEKVGFDAPVQIVKPIFADPEKNDYALLSPKLKGFEQFGHIAYGQTNCPVSCPPYVSPADSAKTQTAFWFGAQISSLDDALMSATGAGSKEGACIVYLSPQCEVSARGLLNMDVIQSIGNTPIKSLDDLLHTAPDAEPITIIRNQKKITI